MRRQYSSNCASVQFLVLASRPPKPWVDCTTYCAVLLIRGKRFHSAALRESANVTAVSNP